MYSRRLLGGVVGCSDGRRKFVDDQIKNWIADLNCLTMIASSQPQAAFAAFTKSLQSKWSFVQRVTPDCQSWFTGLEEVIWKKFLPTLFLNDVSEAERGLYSLPARWGGLGVNNPVKSGDKSYLVSRCATGAIVDAIKNGSDFHPDSHSEQLREAKVNGVRLREEDFKRRGL